MIVHLPGDAALAFRAGFAPQFGEDALAELAESLDRGDPRIQQGAATYPSPFLTVLPPVALRYCPVTFAATHRLRTKLKSGEGVVLSVAHGAFVRAYRDAADRLRLLSAAASPRDFTGWFDTVSRLEAFLGLARECRFVLTFRSTHKDVAHAA